MGDGAKRDRVDEALASWPLASPGDALVDRTLAKLGRAPASGALIDDALFGAPLPAAGGEGTRTEDAGPESREKTRERDRANLKELARMGGAGPASGPVASARPAAEGWEDGSGVVRFDGGGGSASAPASASASAPAPASASAPAPAPASASASGSAPVAGTVPASAPASAPKAPAKVGTAKPPAGSRRWLMLGGGAAAMAAGMVGILFGMSRSPSAAPAAVAQASAAPVVAPPTAVVAVASDRGVNPLDLPAAPPGATGAVATFHGAGGGGASRPGAAPPAPVAAPPPPVETKPAVAVATPPAASGASLEALMQEAAGPAAPRPTAANAPAVAPATGSVPMKPSQGAIQGAMGAAMPGARACLGPDDAISRVNVVFQADGTVASVAVTGGAAGTPAEACIRAALMKAKVSPFAQPTYAVPATVRPN